MMIKEKMSFFLAMVTRSPRNYFKKELALIKDEGIRLLVLESMASALHRDRRNFTGPASSSGKYHPKFDRGYGGTARHTKAVVKTLTTFQEAYPKLDWDCIYAAALLHDLAKYQKGEKYSNRDHATEMMDHVHRLVHDETTRALAEYGLTVVDQERGENVARLIGSHMGRWEKKAHLLPKGFFDKDEAKFLHLADMIVSRKWYGSEVTL